MCSKITIIALIICFSAVIDANLVLPRNWFLNAYRPHVRVKRTNEIEKMVTVGPTTTLKNELPDEVIGDTNPIKREAETGSTGKPTEPSATDSGTEKATEPSKDGANTATEPTKTDAKDDKKPEKPPKSGPKPPKSGPKPGKPNVNKEGEEGEADPPAGGDNPAPAPPAPGPEGEPAPAPAPGDKPAPGGPGNGAGDMTTESPSSVNGLSSFKLLVVLGAFMPIFCFI